MLAGARTLPDRLVIEDLNISGMLANHRLARATSDAGWAEFARILKYKQAWRDGQVVIADRWYPSSKLCGQCDPAQHPGRHCPPCEA
jgi:putative transposase